MAESGITINVIDKTKYFDRLFRRSDHAERLLNRVGQLLVNASRTAFGEQSWGGKRWPARTVPSVLGAVRDLQSGPYVKDQRFQGRPVLTDSGALKQSIGYTILGKTSVRVGSKLPYAGLHQNGGLNSLGVTPTVKRNLAAFLKTRPDRRADLGFLFRVERVSTRVQARPFMGVTPLLLGQIRTAAKDFLLDRGEFASGGAG